MTIKRLSIVSLLAALSLVGCNKNKGHDLSVKVITELVASQDFKTVVTEIVSNDDPTMGIRTLSTIESNAAFGDAFPRGQVVATFKDVEDGDKTVRVRLMTANGSILIERRIKFTLNADQTIPVPLTADCVGVMCPAPGGSAALLACLGGMCVDERCNPEDPTTAEFCPMITRCLDNAACELDGAPACATRECVSGVCIAQPLTTGPNACDQSTQYCDTTTGCRTRNDIVTDGGVDGGGPVCNTICFVDSNPCMAGYWVCDEDAGTAPVCGPLTPVSSGTSCGTGLTCDGAGHCVGPDAG